MPLSKVTTVRGEGGLGRRVPNKDKISGLIFYNDTLPSGFTTTTRSQRVLTLAQAEAKGIVEGDVNHGVEWYHVKEYFRLNPEGELWIHYAAVPVGAYDFDELVVLGEAAGGEIRQYGVYANGQVFASAQVTALQAKADELTTLGYYSSVFYGANFTGIVNAAAEDLRTLSAEKVSVINIQDGNGAGKALYDSEGYSITALGTMLGAVSAASVEQSIGEVKSFNISDGTELETLIFANGDAYDATVAGDLKDKGYQIARKYLPKISGSYFERTPTAITAASDFAFLPNNRVIDKASRLTETILTPELNSTISLNSDGTLTDDVIGYFQDLVSSQLEGMENDGEISAFNVAIDPDQDVLSTSTLEVSISILPIGIAEFINVTIGLVAEL